MDTIETLILELIDTIKTLAPEVFNILVKKQFTDGILLLVVSIILLVVSYRFIYIISKGEDNDKTFIVFPIVTLIIGFVCFFGGINITINPEYYAIKDLISLLTGRP